MRKELGTLVFREALSPKGDSREENHRNICAAHLVNFAGISVNVERGNREAAQKQLQGFKARFEALKETCESCHGTDNSRKYYVDENVQALIDKLGQALSGSSVDPKVVDPLTQSIGMESCTKCHLVHVPAAYAKFSSAK